MEDLAGSGHNGEEIDWDQDKVIWGLPGAAQGGAWSSWVTSEH